MNLIGKGKIGKNVDVITAFEKGTPVLQTHQAIFHHGEEKFTEGEFQAPPKPHLKTKKSTQKSEKTAAHEATRTLKTDKK